MFRFIAAVLVTLIAALPAVGNAQTPPYDVCPRGNPFNFHNPDLQMTIDGLADVIAELRLLAESRMIAEIQVTHRRDTPEAVLRGARRLGLPSDLLVLDRPSAPGSGTVGTLVDVPGAVATATAAFDAVDLPVSSDDFVDVQIGMAMQMSSMAQFSPDTRLLLLEIAVLQRKLVQIQAVVTGMLSGRETWRCLKGYSGLLDLHFLVHDGTDQTPEDFFDETEDESGHAVFRNAIEVLQNTLFAPNGNLYFTIDESDVGNTIGDLQPLETRISEGLAFLVTSVRILNEARSANLDASRHSSEAFQIIDGTYWPNLHDPHWLVSAYATAIGHHLDNISDNLADLADLDARRSSLPDDQFRSEHRSLGYDSWRAAISAMSMMVTARDDHFGAPGFQDQIESRSSAFRAPIEDAMNAFVLSVQVLQQELARLEAFVDDFCATVSHRVTGCGA